MAKKPSGETGPPLSMPQSPPTDYNGHAFSTIIEIHRTLGKVEQAIKDLSERSATQSEKLEEIGKSVYAGKVLLITAGVVLTALGGVAVFFLDKLWNVVVALLQARPHP